MNKLDRATIAELARMRQAALRTYGESRLRELLDEQVAKRKLAGLSTAEITRMFQEVTTEDLYESAIYWLALASVWHRDPESLGYREAEAAKVDALFAGKPHPSQFQLVGGGRARPVVKAQHKLKMVY